MNWLARRWKKILKWTGIVLVVLIVVFFAALVVIDRRLNPSVDAPTLGPIDLPRGAELASGRVIYDSDDSGTYEVWTMQPDGSDRVQLTNDAAFDSWWARLSPDRRTILFYRTPAGVHDLDFKTTSLWMVAADGGEPVEVLPVGSHGWNQHGHAEWSPDGSELVMFAGKVTNPRIFITSADGREIRQLTPQEGTNIDPSWAPDGSQVTYIGCPGRICFGKDQEVFLIPAAGGDRVRLTEDDVKDHDPYFSPDGSKIALLSQVEGAGDTAFVGIWDIRLIDADGSGEVRRLVKDDQINSMPKWLDDDTIMFHRFDYRSLDNGFDIWQVTVSSGDTSVILATLANEEYPEPS